MNLKKKLDLGITLISLVITIVLLLILASVSLNLVLGNNGIITKARQASIVQELGRIEEEIMLRLADEQLNKFTNNEEYDISSYTDLESFSPEIESKYSDYIRIESGKMYLIPSSPEELKKTAERIGIPIKNIINNIKIYGNSIQDGTPTPESPVEIQGVGDLVTDSNDPNYGKYKISVVTASGKNLVNFKDSTEKLNAYYYTQHYFDYKLKGGKEYTISFDYVIENKSDYSMGFGIGYSLSEDILGYNHDLIYKYPFPTQEVGSTGKLVCSFIAPERANGMNLAIRPIRFDAQTYATVLISNFMLEEGNTATDYKPYVEPITTDIYLDEPLRKVGDVADYIDFKNRKIIRNVQKRVLNGTEGWFDYASLTNTSAFGLRLLYDNWHTDTVYTTHFKRIGSAIYDLEGFSSGDTSKNVYFRISSNLIKTLQDFRNWLNINNVTLIYKKEIPTEETLEIPLDFPKLKELNNINVKTQIQPSKIDIIH